MAYYYRLTVIYSLHFKLPNNFCLYFHKVFFFLILTTLPVPSYPLSILRFHSFVINYIYCFSIFSPLHYLLSVFNRPSCWADIIRGTHLADLFLCSFTVIFYLNLISWFSNAFHTTANVKCIICLILLFYQIIIFLFSQRIRWWFQVSLCINFRALEQCHP